MDRRVRGVLRRGRAAQRKERRVAPPARIIRREDYVPAHRGGPGYNSSLKLRAGRKGTGRLLTEETNAWEEELQDKLDELRQIAADLGYRVIEDEATAVLSCIK